MVNISTIVIISCQRQICEPCHNENGAFHGNNKQLLTVCNCCIELHLKCCGVPGTTSAL